MISRRTTRKDSVDEVERRKNRTKARVRSKVEWLFRSLKCVFGHNKVRDRGLKKNHEWLLTAFAPVNFYQQRKRLVTLGSVVSLEAGKPGLQRCKSTSQNSGLLRSRPQFPRERSQSFVAQQNGQPCRGSLTLRISIGEGTSLPQVGRRCPLDVVKTGC